MKEYREVKSDIFRSFMFDAKNDFDGIRMSINEVRKVFIEADTKYEEPSAAAIRCVYEDVQRILNWIEQRVEYIEQMIYERMEK